MGKEEQLKIGGMLCLDSTPKYTLKQILEDPRFYNKLVKTAGLSDSARESSMSVYGNEGGYFFTAPLKELPRRCVWGNNHGLVCDVPGKGLWIKPGHIQLVNLHFHPRGTNLYPSRADLESQISTSVVPFFSGAEIYLSRGLSMIGIKAREGIDLFWSQFLANPENLFTGIVEEYDERINALIRQKGKLSAKGKRKMAEKVAEIFQSTDCYNNGVFSFTNQEEYKKAVKEIKLQDLFLKKNIKEEVLELDSPRDRELRRLRAQARLDLEEEEEWLRRLGIIREEENSGFGIID